MHRQNECRCFGIIAQRASRQSDHPVERGRRYVAMPPDGIQQLIARQQFPRTAYKLHEHREYLGLERVVRLSPPERAIGDVEFALSAAENHLLQTGPPKASRIPHV